jgi:hypothetical protein
MTVITLFPIVWSITRKLGFAAYAGASFFCGVVWLGFRRQRRRRTGLSHLAFVLAAIELVLALDMIFEWRLAFHTFCVNLLMKYNLYQERRPFQAALLVTLGCVLLLFSGSAIRRYRARGGALLAVGGISMSIGLWVLEIISMHEVDQALYHLVKGVMVIAPLWVSACAITVLGVWIEARRPARDDLNRETSEAGTMN